MKKPLMFRIKREIARLIRQISNLPAKLSIMFITYFNVIKIYAGGGGVICYKIYKINKIIESSFKNPNFMESYYLLKSSNLEVDFSKTELKNVPNLDSKISPNYVIMRLDSKKILSIFTNANKENKEYIKKILSDISAIKTWINSNEFKQYLRAKDSNLLVGKENLNENIQNLDSKADILPHYPPKMLYPPISNPKNLDYSKIPFGLLYELNLPIPSQYDFIFFVFGASAHGTIIRFLKIIPKLQIECWHFNMKEDEFNTINVNKPLNSDKKDIFAYYRHFVEYDAFDYRFPFLTQNMPFILLVRDPISRLKTMVNHGFLKPGILTNDFYLHDDIDKALDRKRYAYPLESGGWEIFSYPDITLVNHFVRISQCMNYPYSSIANICQKNVLYIDMSEFLPQNVLQSMQKYAKFFNKDLPFEILQKNAAYLQEKKWTNLAVIIPLNLQIPLSNRILSIHINLKNEIPKDLIEISDLLFDEKYEILKRVGFSINSYDLASLKNNNILLLDVKMYLNKFLQKLILKENEIKNTAQTESSIIEYFKIHKSIAMSFKKLLDIELAHIKTHRSDIVESWKYYKEFEAIF